MRCAAQNVYIREANWDHPDGPRILARADARVIWFRVTLPDEILLLPVYQWWSGARNNASMRYLGWFYQDQCGQTRRDIPGVLRGGGAQRDQVKISIVSSAAKGCCSLFTKNFGSGQSLFGPKKVKLGGGGFGAKGPAKLRIYF